MKRSRLLLALVIIVATAALTRAIEGTGTSTTIAQGAAADGDALKLRELPLTTLIAKVKGTTDVSEKRRYAAAVAAKAPANQKDVDELFTVLEDDSMLFDPKTVPVRNSVVESMRNISNPSLSAGFAKKLKSSSLSVRWVAVDMVGRLKDKEAVPDLIKLVDGYDNWRKKAQKHGATKMEMTEYVIRMAAATSLGDIGDERAIPVLIKHLGKMEGEDEKALALFGQKAFPELLGIIRASKNKEAANAAAGAIRRMKDKSVMEAAWEIAQNNKDAARYAALNMLLDSADNATSPTTDQVMDYVVANATQSYAMQAQAISIAKRRKNVDYLIRAFQNPQVDHGWRTGAIVMLGELKDPAAVPALEAALKDSNSEIRELAAISLKQITGTSYGVNWP